MAQITIEQAVQIALGHHQAGRFALAEEMYQQVLAQDHGHAGALHLLGVLSAQTGRLAAAIDLITRAIAINPAVAEYHIDLGECYRLQGELDASIASFHRALALKPGVAMTHNNLGNALMAQGRASEASAAFSRAVELKPDHAGFQENLGIALHKMGLHDAAIAAYGRARALKPDDSRVHSNLGVALEEAGRTDEAIAAFQRAIELKPDHAAAYNNLANAFWDTGRLDESLAALRTAMAIKPDYAEAASNFLCTLHYHPDYDSPMILTEHRRWAERFAAPLAAEIRAHANDRAPDRRLRIGFVSPDLREHPVGQALHPLFLHRDRAQAEFIGYSDVWAPDGLTEKLRALADEWHETAGLSDAQVAERIRADRIDILVDLSLHTAGNRLLVFARKPAPVQVTMLGMVSTTGLATIDYRLTDPYLDPPGAGDGDYTEQSIRLPRCFWCYEPAAGAPPVGALPALRNGFVTFGCLNQPAKVSRPALDLWVKLLQALPGSRLVLQSPEGSHRSAVHALFEAGGIAATRLDFVTRATRLAYLERFQDLDLALDPFPYNGHTSTFDALWMGVPVVTVAGRTAVSRGGASILSNAGLPEMVARTPEQYAAIAIAWATDLARLAALRATLRSRMLASPLIDGKQYATDVEAAFRWMWKIWCKS